MMVMNEGQFQRIFAIHYNQKTIFKQMIRGDNIPNNETQNESTISMKDFIMGERIKKVTTHDLFELTRNNEVYVAKLFNSQFHFNFQLELDTLRQLKHPNIVTLAYSQPADHDSMGLSKNDMLVFKSAQHGSLNQYIPMNGKLQENAARLIFQEILSGLKHAVNHQPNPIIHPNLTPSSVLLDSERHVKICGWSKVPQKKENKDLVKDLVFCCCEILILMLIGNMPFYKKDPKVDPLFNYLRAEYINKFWAVFEKRINSKHKSFAFSKNAKEMIQKVFLGEWTTIEQIQASSWMKEPIMPRQQFNAYLLNLETAAKERYRLAMQKKMEKSEQKRKIIMEFEEETVHSSSNRASRSSDSDIFIQDFYDSGYTNQDVPASQQCSELIRVFDSRPGLVIATLKQHLRNMEHHHETHSLVCGIFQLENYDIEKFKNVFYLKLELHQTHEKQIQHEEEIVIKVKASIEFLKNTKNQLFAKVHLLESDLCEFYVSEMTRFIEDKVRGV